LAYQGKTDAAIEALKAVAAEAEGVVHTSPWAKVIGERARHLVDLVREGPEAVHATLSNWIIENRRVLKLPVRQPNPNDRLSV
jgi:hypothetical protein